MENPLLAIEGVTVTYQTEAGCLAAVRDATLHLLPRQKYGLVGESGSGKTTLALAVMRYLARNGAIAEGRILFDGVDLLTLSASEMREIWGGRIGMVYQNPGTALNPALRVGDQIAEVARVHLSMNGTAARQRAIEMLATVGMPDPAHVARRFPHELSGGMLQRALIAIALTSNPALLIMDEPTTALDVTTEAVVLDLIQELAQKYGSAILYITHNLGVVARLCDRVGVMYAGQMIEEAPVRDLYRRPLHPYTEGLLRSVPRLDTDKRRARLYTIPGRIPRPNELPQGCVFAPRCPLVESACRVIQPPLVEAEPGWTTACRRWRVLAERDHSAIFVTEPPANGQQTTGVPEPLLAAGGIKKYFQNQGLGGSLLPALAGPPVKAVDGVNLRLDRGTTLGLVGESGSGKTTLGRCLIGLLEPTAGAVSLQGLQLAPSVDKRPRSVLKRLQMVFQNPDASLNPRMSVGEIVGRPLARLLGLGSAARRQRVAELLRSVNLPAHYAARLPEELSGGEKQRVAIARAFAAEPDLIICDEPVSALDVSVQGALLNLLGELQVSRGTTYLFISHDLAAVRYISDYIAVMYLGCLWEVGLAAEVFTPPYHPYTEALLSAIPIPDPDAAVQCIRLSGAVPSAVSIPSGCRFHTRCPRKLGEICEQEEPHWRDSSSTHRLRCHRELDDLRALQVPVLRGGMARPGGES
ncbi:MAG: dipeptide ABC transporter ATP-binding protein [Chloroflexota bacterium]